MERIRFVLSHPDITARAIDWLVDYDHHDIIAEMTIKPYKKNRSLEQNDMFHGWCGTIADKTGHSKQEIKQIMVESTFGTDYSNWNRTRGGSPRGDAWAVEVGERLKRWGRRKRQQKKPLIGKRLRKGMNQKLILYDINTQ